MEGKVLLQDLAQSLAAKNGIQRKDAETFVRAFFETISEGILQDKIVKIKGFGTFKMIDVQDRESVNVNSGERIIIPGHSKISFTPDSELKDQVNRPFALFQTVVINEGTSLDDMEKVDGVVPVPSEVPEDSVAPIPPTVPTIHQEEESKVDAFADGITDVKKEEQIPVIIKDEPVCGDASFMQEESKVQSEVVRQTTADEHKKHSWWYVGPSMTALLFALLWIVFLTGYFIGSNNWLNFGNIFDKPIQHPQVEIDTVYVEKMIEPDSAYIKGLEDSIRSVIKQESTIKKELPKPQTPQVTQVPAKPVVADKKSPVVYEIVGQKGVRTIQWGDYLLKIVRQEYGTDDALRYVISYNKFTDPNNLPVGTEVKLPKLRVK